MTLTFVTESAQAEATAQNGSSRRFAPRIAVLVPCLNESLTIGKVVDDFRAAAPTATVYVFDNNSTDDSPAIAVAHGATLVRVRRQGKGNVVRAMMSSVDADAYIMVDGDDTYTAESLDQLIQPVLSGEADMVVGARLDTAVDEQAFRPLHELGNRAFCRLVGMIFRTPVTDMLSGYRAFNARVAKFLPIVSSGFEVEAEMTIQCMYYDFTVLEIPVPYRSRPSGSTSKLSTFRDGLRILAKVIHLLRAYKPLTFFGTLGILSLVFALALNLVYERIIGPNSALLPTLSSLRDTLLWSSGISIGIGIMLHTLNYRVKELHTVITKGTTLRR
jgi:glycosyltransferase involved in cell wall biosynthesis